MREGCRGIGDLEDIFLPVIHHLFTAPSTEDVIHLVIRSSANYDSWRFLTGVQSCFIWSSSEVQPDPQPPFRAAEGCEAGQFKDIIFLTERPRKGHVQEGVMGKDTEVSINEVLA